MFNTTLDMVKPSGDNFLNRMSLSDHLEPVRSRTNLSNYALALIVRGLGRVSVAPPSVLYYLVTAL